MSVGVLTSNVFVDNVTHTVFHGFGVVGTSSGGVEGGGRPPLGKHCKDRNQRLVGPGVHFVPGPDECTLCICDEGEPKWCKAVLCSPPQDCKSFRVGNSCCDFICLDDSLNHSGPKTGGPYMNRPVEVPNFVPKVVIAAVTAMLSLSLLFFLIHRLRQRHIQGRLNSARARRSTPMCDECDDTRSLDFSNDFFEHRMNSPHLYPPQYLAWWKPPSSYFPPRGEAPPPYEEAMATTSIGGPPIQCNNNNLQNHHNNHTSNPLGVGSILNDIPIIVPPPALPLGLGTQSARAGCTPAIARLASVIAGGSTSGGSGPVCTTVITSALSPPSTSNGIAKGPENTSKTTTSAPSGAGCSSSRPTTSSSQPKSERSKKSSKLKNKLHLLHQLTRDPEPGPSRSETDSEGGFVFPGTDTINTVPFRIRPPQHGVAPPPYEDAMYPVNSIRDCLRENGTDFYQRHSLTLPTRPYDIFSGGSSIVHGGAGGRGPMTCYTEDEMNRRLGQYPNQRYSLQFPVGITGDEDGRGDWSSSSSTLSLSTAPNSPVGRPPSISSSSEDSVSESNQPPPPPANK